MKNSIKNWAAALLWLAASALPLHAQDASTDTLSEEPLPLPFVEYFDSEESLANWTIRDSAGNILEDTRGFMQWRDSRGAGETPYLHYQSRYSGEYAYLVSAPMDIAMGKAYLSLFIQVGSQGNGQILYGSSPNPQEMEILQEIAYENSEFKHIICQFEASGVPLYFAFFNRGNFRVRNLGLDAIEIGQGEYKPHPRCQILEMELPASGYDLDSIDFSVTIANEGTAPAYGKDMSLLYNVNERVHRSIQLVQDTIQSNGSSLIELLNIAMLPGRNKISVQLEGTDSIYSGIVYNNQPLYPPHRINLGRGEMYAGSEEALGHEYMIGSFVSEDFFTPNSMIEAPIIRSEFLVDFPFISIPFYLEKDIIYKIDFEYQGGAYSGKIDYGNFQLIIGQQENAYDTWNTLWHDSAIYTFDWTKKEVSFSVAESGLYSFGFWNHGYNMCIQPPKIEWANDEKDYDIALTDTWGGYLPLSGCGLDQIEVTAMVQNLGSTATHGFDAYYILNETDTVREYIYADIAPKAVSEIAFNEYALLNKGKNTVRVNLDMYNDRNSSNNISKLSEKHVIYNHLPLQTPHTIDFTKEEMGISTMESYGAWSLVQLTNGEWAIGMTNDNTLISSTCFELQAGEIYCLSFEHCGGSLFASGHEFPVNPYISIYDASNGIENDLEIWSESNVLTYDYMKRKVYFSVEKDGFYAFAFGKKDDPEQRMGRISYKSISLTKVLEYDISTKLLSGIPCRIPIEHVNGELPISVSVENNGLLEANTRVDIFLNDKTAGTRTTSLLPDETGVLAISAKSENMEIGDTVTLFIQGSIEGHEGEDINPGHKLSKTFTISDTNMAYYQSPNLDVAWGFTTASYAVNGPRGIAMPFRFSHPDTLTSISIGWAYLYDLPLPQLQLAIYPFDAVNQKIADIAIYQSEISRPRDSGWMVYDIPDLLLSGDVLVCIMQMDHNNMGISVDRSLEGYYYRYTLMTDSLWKETLAGYPAITLNLGHNGVLDLKQDAEMVAFVNPSANIGAFAANEPITVKVKNNSADSVDVPVHLLINNQEAGSTTLRIAPYVFGNAVIEADLSQPNTQYDICVFAAMENDEDRSNDTLRMSLTTVPAMDPYVMDFEYTPDFAISDFQPEWITVDNDGMPTYGWQYVSFPHTYEAFGFISFNPASTTPPIIEEFEMKSIQGRRFGASFGTIVNNADDWLISPKLQMPPSGSKISFWVKSLTRDYGYDQYRVLVSTTTNALESFEPVTDFREAPDWDWKQEVVDLSAYNGKEIYIAIQRYQGEQGYGFVFMIDDIRVDKTGTGTESDASILGASLYPNPAQEKVTIFCDAGIQEVEIIDMNGRVLFAKQGLNQDTFVYNVENLSPGLYFAKVRSSQGLQVLKFTVIE